MQYVLNDLEIKQALFEYISKNSIRTITAGEIEISLERGQATAAITTESAHKADRD